ncbi:MAG: RnfABCDGE type electron transport complex subunit D [Lentisphaerae bacterium]|nr:RnfABCDGE type electron transport complex subunit D [Lentisphaerota bacterium]
MNTIVSPFLRRGPNARDMMTGMLACLTVATVHFGLRYDAQFPARYALYLVLASLIDIFYVLLKDGRLALPRASTLVTAALLVLSVPARIPWWQIVAGLLVAILFGKRVVDPGALRVNPMLLGRLFMMLVFADSIQTWLAPGAEIDALSSATPLGLQASEGVAYSPLKIWMGDIHGDWEGIYAILPGAPGEVLPLLTLLCGLVLYMLGILDWRSGVMYIAGFALTCVALDMPLGIHLAAGATIFTAVYIVTDPRSMPGSKFGRLAAGVLAGALNAGIRKHGFYPEGVVLAVLFVNLLGPTLDRIAFQGRAYLLRRRAKARSQDSVCVCGMP